MTSEAFVKALIDAGVIADPLNEIAQIAIRCTPGDPVRIEITRWTNGTEILHLVTEHAERVT
jgi:hypothetical protein